MGKGAIGSGHRNHWPIDKGEHKSSTNDSSTHTSKRQIGKGQGALAKVHGPLMVAGNKQLWQCDVEGLTTVAHVETKRETIYH